MLTREFQLSPFREQLGSNPHQWPAHLYLAFAFEFQVYFQIVFLHRHQLSGPGVCVLVSLQESGINHFF